MPGAEIRSAPGPLKRVHHGCGISGMAGNQMVFIPFWLNGWAKRGDLSGIEDFGDATRYVRHSREIVDGAIGIQAWAESVQ